MIGAASAALSAGRQLHVGAGRHPDGEDHHARRSRSATMSSPSRTARTSMARSAPPTSSWPPPRAPRPASSWRSRSARWCSPSSPWSRSLTAARRDRRLWSTRRSIGTFSPASRCSATSACSGSRLCLQPVMYMLNVPWNEAGDRGRPVRHQGRAQRVRRLHRSQGSRPARRCRRPRSRSSPSCCAASPISARSRSRWR